GDALANGPGLHGTMDPVKRIFIALPQIHRASTERIARAAVHSEPALKLAQRRSEFRLALDHLLGWIPVRPFLLVVDGRGASPAKSFTPNADPVAQRASAGLHQIEIATRRIDNDRARLLGSGVSHGGAQIRRIETG